jgi:hypothetical protein
MDKLNLLGKLKLIVKSYPEEWDDVDLVDDPEEFFEFVQRFGGPAKLDRLSEDEKWIIYDLVKYNYDRLSDGSLNRENVVVPDQKEYTVSWSHNTTQYVRDYGQEKYIGADKESIDKRVSYEVSNNYFDYDSYDSEVVDREGGDFDYDIFGESIRKTTHRVLKEHYKLFINKKN